MNVTPFAQSVYDLTKQIPKGKVSTYKNIAKALGKPGACQAVGQALRRNPYAPEVPCHRVISTDFSLGGFIGSTAIDSDNLRKKIRLLKDENILIDLDRIKNSRKYRKSILFDFN
ncbi:MAG: cysteine methyltransferase [Hyperionvirus sp.]|uniref:Cysteine methyltransferase n=1 Tax=Hyperionvirus sp. TaxID=2487770 RepID=A0A3G5A9Y8_9VIRU|nr:MAG: cysteine methyltransferase [Hyperionvirus sp.]